MVKYLITGYKEPGDLATSTETVEVNNSAEAEAIASARYWQVNSIEAEDPLDLWSRRHFW